MIDASSQINISPRLARIERWVPGVRTLHTHKTAGLPRDLVSGAVLPVWAALRGQARRRLIGWGLGVQVAMLCSAVRQLPRRPGWPWALVLTSLVIYTLALIETGVAGVSLRRDLY